MKNYNEVEMLAKNAPSGSYAAGCPTKDVSDAPDPDCKHCESRR